MPPLPRPRLLPLRRAVAGAALGALALLGLALGCGPASPANLEFAGLTGWLNSGPVTLAGLRAERRVVLVDFWTANCSNCRATRPYLKTWHAKYAAHGLTVVGVHTPEFDYEREAAAVRKVVETDGIRFPVAQDNDRATWKAFRTRAWPTKHLIGADGARRYSHVGEGDYAAAERAIRAALTAAGYDVSAIPEGGVVTANLEDGRPSDGGASRGG